MHARLKLEILIVLAVTFGMSGLKAAMKLIDAWLSPTPLNQKQVVLNDSVSRLDWLDVGLQLASAGTLIAWGLLALYLLAVVPAGSGSGSGSAVGSGAGSASHVGFAWRWPGWRDWAWGAGLAALIGLPGLALYVGALHFGFSAEVVPATDSSKLPLLLAWSFANAFGEEIVVVMWFVSRLRQLGVPVWGAIAGSAVLRGSYHLYQGFSAGLGNVVMGVVFAWFYARTGKVWPLILAHFLIDAVAYIGYLFLDLSWLGI
ncbi:CPBP family intramembrane metalloprotease [Corynebacterium sp. CCUG 65737]|uniref:CPBP family intramembrane glutamic endopeptidase n=1 Tax=Corynebacterium sp. CCUG 65737 TaxID=2823889 RepID=UPI00210C7A43|nr:CPBP family intramembrane glutamic endopeptidase [Corynebacterium sp. CCUG 65737]MCQ4627841.1 CPBP family intramembrane metalloprotease [Corynebacterium sp. CCUG 65737]